MPTVNQETSGGHEPILRTIDVAGSADRGDSLSPVSDGLDKLLLYREIVARSNDAIAIIDAHGRYIEQNDAHQRLTSYTSEELKDNTPAIDLGQPVFQMISNTLATQGTFRGEVVCHSKTQGDVPVEISAFAIKDNLGQPLCYIGVKRDIRDRKRADQEREDLLSAERTARCEAE